MQKRFALAYDGAKLTPNYLHCHQGHVSDVRGPPTPFTAERNADAVTAQAALRRQHQQLAFLLQGLKVGVTGISSIMESASMSPSDRLAAATAEAA